MVAFAQERVVESEIESPVEERKKRVASQRKIEANRCNALKSTGPRTAAGKKRASQNSFKHGLCKDSLCLPSECEFTFNVFEGELHNELQPRSHLQKLLFPQITNLIWRLRRLPEAQTKIYSEELAKEELTEGEMLSPSDLLAKRFASDSKNGFLLLNRYERSMENALLRLLKQYYSLKKHHPTTPYHEDEPPVPRERAWREPNEQDLAAMRRQQEAGQQTLEEQERTQTEPGETVDSAPRTTIEDQNDTPRITERSQNVEASDQNPVASAMVSPESSQTQQRATQISAVQESILAIPGVTHV